MRDWPPVSPPSVKSAGVRRSMSKASTSKAAERASFSLIKSSKARVRRSESFCSFVWASAAIMPPILAAWRRCSCFHKPHPPRSAGTNKASFCHSSSSGRSRIRFAAFRTVSSTEKQNSFVESDPSTRRRWMLLCGMHSRSRQLAACTAGRPAGAWSVISWMCWDSSRMTSALV